MAAISIGIIVCLAFALDLEKTVAILRAMPVSLLALSGCIAIFSSFIIGGYKWMRILKALGHEIPFSKILFVRLGSEPIKFIIPAKGGELARPAYLKAEFSVPLPISLGSVAQDKIFNFAGLLLIFAFASSFTISALLGVSVFAVCALCLVLGTRAARPISKYFQLKKRPIFHSLGELIGTFDTLAASEIILQTVLGGVFMFAEMCTGFLCLRAAGVQVPFIIALTYIPAVVMMVQIPVTVSGIGSREAGIILMFGAYAAKDALFASGIAFTVTELFIPVIFGLPWMWPLILKIDLKNILKQVTENGPENG